RATRTGRMRCSVRTLPCTPCAGVRRAAVPSAISRQARSSHPCRRRCGLTPWPPLLATERGNQRRIWNCKTGPPSLLSSPFPNLPPLARHAVVLVIRHLAGGRCEPVGEVEHRGD